MNRPIDDMIAAEADTAVIRDGLQEGEQAVAQLADTERRLNTTKEALSFAVEAANGVLANYKAERAAHQETKRRAGWRETNWCLGGILFGLLVAADALIWTFLLQ